MKPTIDVYCGDPIGVESERIFLERLSADLLALNAPALILANFLPPQNPLQIDFLVVTLRCVCHVELKKLTAPVVGGANGPWQLQMPDGSRRSLDAKNPYRQALDGKYAISDQMHAFASNDPSVPSLAGGKKFYSHLESVVCIFPELLPGSSVYEDHKVRVLGYRDFLTLLATRQTNPGWTMDHWVAFAMHLGLVRAQDSADRTPPETRAAQQAVADYARRFEAFYERDLPANVPTPMEGNDGIFASDTLLDALIAGEHLQLIGPSGCGKSLLAKHMALTAVRRGRLAIVAHAREYDGKLSVLMDRSAAHLYPDTALQLMRVAERVGCPVVLILDGFNECPLRLQENLIKDLHAFSLRSPTPILITAQERVPASELKGRTLAFAPLNRKHKLAVLRAYAEDHLPTDAEVLVEPFQTPYEVSLAAGCLEDAACLASRAALFDAYIQRRCETTTNSAVVRRVLCAVAARMHQRLVSGLPAGEVRQLTAKVLSDENARTQLLTEALSCGLLEMRQGRCSFRHELLERSLQAEALVQKHGSSADVGLALMMPRNRPVAEFVVAMEANPEAVRRYLEALADPTILLDCLRGRCGEVARDVAARESARVIEAAEQALAHTVVQLTGNESWKSLDVTEGPVWSSYDRALMQAVGKMLAEGLLLDEVFRLIARTEERCRAVLTESEIGGTLARADVMSLFAGLYVFTRGDATSCLPASTIYHSSRFCPPRNSDGAAVWRVLSRLAESLEERLPGELLLFCEMLRFATPELLHAIVPRLLRTCWRTGIYHLRLDALQMAQWHATKLSGGAGGAREEVESFLSALHPSDIFLSTALVETLGAFGMLQPLIAAADAAEDLAAILGGSPEDAAMQERAYSAVSNIFEDVYQGVFWEAISQLHREDRMRLLTMAALGAPSYGFSTDWILGELLEYADARSLPAFLRWATTIETKSGFNQEAWARYVLGMRGCSQYLDQPPAPKALDAEADEAWHACGAIIFWLYKPGLAVAERQSAAAQWWQLIHSKWPLQAVGLLLQLGRANYRSGRERRPTLDELCSIFPDGVRQVLEFGLVNRAGLTGIMGWMHLEKNTELASLIRWLGVVGNRQTVRLLDQLVDTPDLGPYAIEALRSLDRRHSGA